MKLPRAFSASIDQLRRDLTTVARSLRGERSPVVVARRAGDARDARDARGARAIAPRTLRIAEVVRETKDAVSLVLEDPTGGALTFRPGQFVTLLVTLDGETLRRAYSVSSDCRDTSRITIAVKRVAGGRVSSHINATFAAGQSVRVLGPSGSFGITPTPSASRHVLLLAGGSGITPMMAIARAVLGLEPRSRVTLVYGNRSETDIVYAQAIADLVRAHGDRFVVRHVLEEPSPAWEGGRGRLDREVLRAELDRLPIDGAEIFLCGPEGMMLEARAVLAARGAGDRVHEERFTSPHLRAAPGERKTAEPPDAAGPQLLTIRIGGVARAIEAAPGATVLEAGLGAGLAMPYSCAMGGCAACKVKLDEGDIEMEEPNCLTAAERAEGYVLACVSRLKRASTVTVTEEA